MVRCQLRFLPLVFALTLTASVVSAEEADDAAREKARGLGYAGVQAYQEGDYVAANERLERAYALLPVPSLGLWSARALLKLGKLVEGAERYQQVTNLAISAGTAEVQRQAQLDARRELALVTSRIPLVRLRVQGAPAIEVTVTVDGVPLPPERILLGQRVNPGPHRVIGSQGERRVEVAFDVAEGAEREVVLTFGPARAAAMRGDAAQPRERPGSSKRRNETLGWVAVGVGGAGVAFGTITGLIALAKKGSLEDSGNCWEHHCLPAERDRVDSYNSLRTLSTVGFVAGAAFSATGVVLLLMSNRSRAAAQSSQAASSLLALRVQSTGALLSGRF